MKLRSSFPLLALVLVACAEDGVTDKPSTATTPALPTPGYTGGTPVTARPVGGVDFAYGANGSVNGTIRSPLAFASLVDGTTYVAHGKAVPGESAAKSQQPAPVFPG